MSKSHKKWTWHVGMGQRGSLVLCPVPAAALCAGEGDGTLAPEAGFIDRHCFGKSLGGCSFWTGENLLCLVPRKHTGRDSSWVKWLVMSGSDRCRHGEVKLCAMSVPSSNQETPKRCL